MIRSSYAPLPVSQGEGSSRGATARLKVHQRGAVRAACGTVLLLGVGCGDLAGPDRSGPDPTAVLRDSQPTGLTIGIDSFGFPAPGGIAPLRDFDINDSGDIVAGRSLLRADGSLVTFGQIINTRAVDVNATGEVLLWTEDSGGDGWSVAASNPHFSRKVFFTPEAMNDRRQAVGSELSDETLIYGASLRDWDLNSVTDLHAQIVAALKLDAAEAMSIARSINDAGQVVGSFREDALAPEVGFLWRNGAVTSLGGLGGVDSWANDINEAGHVVGARLMSDSSVRAFLWRSGNLTDLGTLGGADAFATSINDLGQVVGHSTTAEGATHPFIWYRGVMYDLGLPAGATEGFAHAINNNGKVVGSVAPSGENKGFVWTFEFEDGPAIPVGLLSSAGQGHTPVNRRSNGTLTVTVLGSFDADVDRIDPSSVTLGDGIGLDVPVAQRPNGGYQLLRRDVDRDGHADLALDFHIQWLVANGDLTAGPGELVLRALTLDGAAIEGTLSVRAIH